MNEYEQRQADRRQRMQDRAARLRQKSNIEYRKADMSEEATGIPFGQPILVGHHSEGKHRRTIERAHNAMHRSIELDKKADELERRAANPSTAISSDDPDAAQKLRDKIQKAKATQEKMKAANKAIRKNDRAAVIAMGFTEDQADNLFKPDFCNRVGFPSYALTNNNANIRRMEQRLKQLENAPTESTETERAGVRVIENAEANRIQLVFDGKPAPDIRAILKGRGFKWSPRFGAWQRHLNGNGRYAAKCALDAIEALTDNEKTA